MNQRLSPNLLDSIVVEDGEGDRYFPDSPRTDESEWSEVFRKADNLLDQLVASETGPRRGRRNFSRRDAMQK